MKNFIKNNWYKLLAGVMLILAIPEMWAYGYYEILRWVVTAVALYSAYSAYENQRTFWVFAMGAIAILFNPLAPIHLEKETWVILDIITAILMFVSVKNKKI